ncbi:hypothetical protein BGW38_000069 [Lunasporangiospora selenospora]|uniref:Uncharacterized protein n=1 Tax=Lunasporangiospora selenospora TaxID=979761 RepID=A0A9P6G277_9FUNG|nr:hypothetical protein BGW38_000069 [Lunasporangiospora selenospora]
MLGVRKYITRRQEYLMSEARAKSYQATTVLVCGLPSQENNIDSLYGIFHVLPGGIRRIWMAYKADDLQKECNDRIALTNKLEAAECTLLRKKLKRHQKSGRRQSVTSENSTNLLSDMNNGGGDGNSSALQSRQQQSLTQSPDESFPVEERPQHRPASFPKSLFATCLGIKKVDSIQTYRSELSNLSASIQAKQQAAMTAMHDGQEKNKMGAAFIQFNNQMSAHLAAQSVIHRKTLTMGPRFLEVQPTDVIWGNIGFSLRTRNIRRAIAMAMATVLIVFWSIPVTFVASVAKLDALVSFAPFLSGIYNLPQFVVGIIQGLLPPIGLAILMALLPIFLYQFAHFGGEVLGSRKTLQVVTSYHWFSVVHVLLVTTLANGIFAAIQDISNNPGMVMQMLATSLPQASTFFLTFILTSFMQIPMMLLQIGPLIGFIIGKFLASTPRQVYAGGSTLGSVDWGTTIPVHTIAFSIGKWISEAERVSVLGGLIFPRIVDQVYVAVIIFELVILGLFILDETIAQSIVMFVLLVVTIMAIIISRNKVFRPLIKYLPIEAFHYNETDLENPEGLGAKGASATGRAGTNSGLLMVGDNGLANREVLNSQERSASPSEKVNPIPAQESFHEKAPYKDPQVPVTEPEETRQIFSPVDPSSRSPRIHIPVTNATADTVEHQRQGSIHSILPSIRVENTADSVDTNDNIISAQSPSIASPIQQQTRYESGADYPVGSANRETGILPSEPNMPSGQNSLPSISARHHLSRQGSEYGGFHRGGASSLQVLGANHSVLSASDPAAEVVVPEEYAFVNPALWKGSQPIWLPKDPRGFAELETLELNNAGLASTTDSATMDMKGKISVDVSQRDVAPGDPFWG